MSTDKFLTARLPFSLTVAALLLFFSACRTGQQPTQTGSASKTKSQDKAPAAATAEKPSFEGEIEHVSLYPVPSRREDLAMTLVVTVRNSGAPSVAQGWKLEVNSPSRRFPTVLDPVHINGSVELPGTSGAKVDLAKEDLVTKTAQVSIGKSKRVNGVLTFVLSRTSENEVSNNNTTLTIDFKDSQDNSYRTRRYVIGSKVKAAAQN